MAYDFWLLEGMGKVVMKVLKVVNLTKPNTLLRKKKARKIQVYYSTSHEPRGNILHRVMKKLYSHSHHFCQSQILEKKYLQKIRGLLLHASTWNYKSILQGF